jgi:hypothetical protein
VQPCEGLAPRMLLRWTICPGSSPMWPAPFTLNVVRTLRGPRAAAVAAGAPLPIEVPCSAGQ